jgi:DNA-binding NtrC family response regulator
MGQITENPKNQPDQALPLAGKTVLLVEDEYYIADDLRRTLNDAGAAIVGPFATVSKAHQALDEGKFDCAVIDLNLHGESGLPLADRLMQQGKSFAIATGYGEGGVPDEYSKVPRIEKPFDPRALLQIMRQLSRARES